MRVAVVGKGGAGKSVLAGTLARVLARDARRVLALDSDLMPGLAISLGADLPPEPPLLEAAERDEEGRWRLKRGIGPVRAVERYAVEAPDGVRLLYAGKWGRDGLAPVMPALQAFHRVVHGLRRAQTFRDWAIIGDLTAGPRQTAFGWAPYAETYLLVVEPTWKSVLTARRVARIASSRGARAVAAANKVDGRVDARRVERLLALPVIAAIPADDAVRAAERLGRPLIDEAPSSAAVRAVERLAARLERG